MNAERCHDRVNENIATTVSSERRAVDGESYSYLESNLRQRSAILLIRSTF
jgi:hypothetical protein